MSTEMQKTKDVTNSNKKKVIVVCSTGISATLIDGGNTFHHTFNSNRKDATPDMIGENVTLDVDLIIVDEFSMIPSIFIVMMGEKLRKT